MSFYHPPGFYAKKRKKAEQRKMSGKKAKKRKLSAKSGRGGNPGCSFHLKDRFNYEKISPIVWELL